MFTIIVPLQQFDIRSKQKFWRYLTSNMTGKQQTSVVTQR